MTAGPPAARRCSAAVAELEARLRAMPPAPQDLTPEERGAVARALAARVPTVPGFGLRASIALARRRLEVELAQARVEERRAQAGRP